MSNCERVTRTHYDTRFCKFAAEARAETDWSAVQACLAEETRQRELWKNFADGPARELFPSFEPGDIPCIAKGGLCRNIHECPTESGAYIVDGLCTLHNRRTNK